MQAQYLLVGRKEEGGEEREEGGEEREEGGEEREEGGEEREEGGEEREEGGEEREEGGEERDEVWSQVVTGLHHTQETAGPHRDREVSSGQHLKQHRHHLMCG